MAPMRISGFSSGLDADALVKDVMKAEQAKMDKVTKSKILIEWEQEAYRSVINEIRDFQSEYFDILKPSDNFRSPSALSEFEYKVTTANGKESNAASIIARADGSVKEHTLNEIKQIATKDTWSGVKSNIRGIVSGDIDISEFKTSMGQEKFEMLISVGSTSKKISLSSDEISALGSVEDLATKLNEKIKENFGNDYTSVVSADGNKLKFDMTGSEIRIMKFSNNEKSLEALKVKNGDSSYAFANKTLGELFGITDEDLKGFAINGVEIPVNANMTIRKMTSIISDSSAGVEVNYDSLRDKVTMRSKHEGSANNISIEGNAAAETVFSKLFGVSDINSITREKGKNAVVTLDGVEIIKGENTFTHEGMTITLKNVSNEPVHLKANVDSDKVVEKIEKFVNSFNKMLDGVYTKISEKRNRNYKPLTEEEKEHMTEKQIEKWEKLGKQGLLRNKTELNEFFYKIREAIIAPIEGSNASLASIGISSKSYLDRGKLSIDKNKLKHAVENRFDDVVSVFTKTSDIDYSEEDKRSERYKQNGISARIDDIMKDYVRVTRNKNGKKGILLEKAGIEKDTSSTNNFLSKRIKEYDNKLHAMMTLFAKKEEDYYRKFSRMEKALAKLQAQSSSLISGLVNGGGR